MQSIAAPLPWGRAKFADGNLPKFFLAFPLQTLKFLL